MTNMNSQQQKTIIVTGASRGIGYQLCLALAKLSHQVIAISRTRPSFEQFPTQKKQIIFIEADLIDSEQRKNAIEKIKSQITHIDALVNNAGILIKKKFIDLSNEEWITQFTLNAFVPIWLTKELIPYFSSHSHIVNISSIGGIAGERKIEGLSAYSASKAALNIITESLAVELKPHHISVNALALGTVQTTMLKIAFPNFQSPITPITIAQFIAYFTCYGHHVCNGQILPIALNKI